MALKLNAQGAGERATVVKDGILRFGVESARRPLLCRFVDEFANSAHFKIRHYKACSGRIRHFTQRRGELAQRGLRPSNLYAF